ncbi:MAG: 16S rRNA (cytosine(967)-C(5))-methyltransferase RsmB [Saccharofermentans sp.]|nr:16S rRNA (cytosine(967)-C(5))-methyltransferase RsmB [Saccharofermentans sp.]
MSTQIRYKKKDIIKLIEAGNERELCFLMLYQVYFEGAFSNLVIKKADKAATETGKKLDFTRAMLYGTLSYTFTIDFLIRHITKEEPDEMDPVTRTVIRMAVWQLQFGENIPDYAVTDSSVEIAKKYNHKVSGYVNAVVRKYASAPEAKKYLEQYKPGIRVSLKPEIYGIFKKDYGKSRAFDIGSAFLKPSGTTVRFDSSKIGQDMLIKELKEAGIYAQPAKLIADAIEITGGLKGLENSDIYSSYGMFIQGEAAMLASLIADPTEGSKILDCCSAPGGKSTHMATMCHDNCSILSCDISEARLQLVTDNANRLGLKSISVKCCDASKIGKENKDLRKSFDLVLCDVPCSGLGLIGRKPDIREKITFERIEELLPLQQEILDSASKMVAPGGTLVYCTCTLNRDENESQVESFLETHKSFHTVSVKRYLPDTMEMDEGRKEAAENGMVTLFPDIDGCEGFFICRMEKDRKEDPE